MLGSSLFPALPGCDTLCLEQSHLQHDVPFGNEVALGVTGDERGFSIPHPVTQTSLANLTL